MNEVKKRYRESKKSLNEENIKLRIENEVIKRQLVSIRDMINNILGETTAPCRNNEEHQISICSDCYSGELFNRTYRKQSQKTAEEIAKDIQRQTKKELLVPNWSKNKTLEDYDQHMPSKEEIEEKAEESEKGAKKCINCQKLGKWEKGFCLRCLEKEQLEIPKNEKINHEVKKEPNSQPAKQEATGKPANFLDELKQKQQEGKMKPSEVKKNNSNGNN